ncbi:MAG TPA: PhnD/SsuA/transferrin family substrate-binding protein [Ramlibacter sp.]|jgi:ABC-type phosphate/phosphonate transport system substrate-binding protein|nr:PhnD/SsuA/transferrin family substrate-binding protein [Ramlibacter sp.]
MPIANARMYSATPAVAAAWKELLAWVLRRADLDWEVIDYVAPKPLSELWARDDLGIAMMCGLPFSEREPQPTLIAAPVPSPERYGAKPVYMADIVIRAGSPYRSIEDTAGAVVGYTLADSVSGSVAPRRFLSGIAYRAEVSGLLNPRAVIDALAQGRIDVGPLDSYYHDLLRADTPGFASQVRTIASAPPLPIPPLVATAPLAPALVQRMRDALSEVERAPELNSIRERLLLRGFAFPDPADYAALARSSP